MNHPDPNAFVEQLMSFTERLDRQQLPGGWTELPVAGPFGIRDRKSTKCRDYFALATIHNGFVPASGCAS